jgi:glutamate/tyrosine decarboxylase-like PLP-dependent enzyme
MAGTMPAISPVDRLPSLKALLSRAEAHALKFLDTLPDRPVAGRRTVHDLRTSLGGPLPEAGLGSIDVLDLMAREGQAAAMASAGPRFFGFVIGGSFPIALAADWLTSAWDQNAGLYVTAPAVSVMEETAARWLLDLFGLPPTSGVGFVTGGQMANFTCLAAARHEVLRRAGWDVESKGLAAAPRVHVIVGEEVHVTVLAALRLLGLGEPSLRVPTDGQGRIRASELTAAVAACGDGPMIVCAQAGNVNTGAFDPIGEIADATSARGAWLHVDGAFGLWAAAVPSLKDQAAGIERADSWSVDAHKWLNVPYDCGMAICANAAAHRAAMTSQAAYLMPAEGEQRDGLDWSPEFSRRARGVPAYAALRVLGRQGVIDLIERPCALARRFAEKLAKVPRVKVLNEVTLNQVLVRFEADDAAVADARTRSVILRLQEDGTCWLSGTTWHGMAAMRISVSNWSTTERDVDRTVDAIAKMAGTADN